MHPRHLFKLPCDEPLRGHDHEPLPPGPQEAQGPLEVAVAADEDRHVVIIYGVEHVQDDLDVQVRLPDLPAVIEDDDLQLLGDDGVADVGQSRQEPLLPRVRGVLLPDIVVGVDDLAAGSILYPTEELLEVDPPLKLVFLHVKDVGTIYEYRYFHLYFPFVLNIINIMAGLRAMAAITGGSRSEDTYSLLKVC
ncbi:MAG: hypothetical protein METHAR1v1_840004 [Methanothrix sp.]|nr:MAG: hypothetical protein METHAR1v1_840004 [Methanothrix sp.]